MPVLDLILNEVMEEIFQKNAKLDREADLRRTGVLDATSFDDYSSLRAFLPAEELRPLVSHYWIVRWDIPEGITYRPTEILAEPAINIFFMQNEAFLYGLTTQTFDYTAINAGVMAGATFQPGGFYPFWNKDMKTLPSGRSDLAEFFPEATVDFSNMLLAQDDEQIAQGIEDVLLKKPIIKSPNIATITAITNAINFGEKLRSLDEVSQYFHIPARTLQHLFQREVGVSLKWIIMRARMLEALEAAYKHDKPDWAAIAAELGYSSQEHFITDFKRATGQTPATFKKRF